MRALPASASHRGALRRLSVNGAAADQSGSAERRSRKNVATTSTGLRKLVRAMALATPPASQPTPIPGASQRRYCWDGTTQCTGVLWTFTFRQGRSTKHQWSLRLCTATATTPTPAVALRSIIFLPGFHVRTFHGWYKPSRAPGSGGISVAEVQQWGWKIVYLATEDPVSSCREILCIYAYQRSVS